MRVAALDLGSNTSLLLIADVSDGRLHQLHDETTITRLGQGVHSERRFHPDALHRMQQCLVHYRDVIDTFKAEKIIAVATSAARDVSNGQELIDIGARLGIPIHIISGEREAELTFRGALCEPESDRNGIAVVDVGGGSTEIIAQHGAQVIGHSVDVGSVRLTELFVKHDPIQTGELAALRDYIRQALARVALPKVDKRLVAVAGTPTTLAALEQAIAFDEKRIHGFKMSLADLDRWFERLAGLTLAQRSRLPGMQPKRADVIVAGTCILQMAVRALGQTEITVSTRGVRYGLAVAWEEFCK